MTMPMHLAFQQWAVGKVRHPISYVQEVAIAMGILALGRPLEHSKHKAYLSRHHGTRVLKTAFALLYPIREQRPIVVLSSAFRMPPGNIVGEGLGSSSLRPAPGNLLSWEATVQQSVS